MRTKHLIRQSKKLGLSKSQVFRLIKSYRAFKICNRLIFKRIKQSREFSEAFKDIGIGVHQLRQAFNGLTNVVGEMVNQFVELSKFIENNLLDEGERAFLYDNGN